jgi:hypothetical protein
VAVVVVIQLVIEAALGGGAGTAPITVFAWFGEISTLLILVAYGLVTVGAGVFLFARPMLRRQAPLAHPAELLIPVAGLALLGYTVYRNVVPYPTGASAWLPVVAGAWLAAAVILVMVAPGSSRRLGERMVTDEGMESLDLTGPERSVAPAAR